MPLVLRLFLSIDYLINPPYGGYFDLQKKVFLRNNTWCMEGIKACSLQLDSRGILHPCTRIRGSLLPSG
jgi:hypothetical protein